LGPGVNALKLIFFVLTMPENKLERLLLFSLVLFVWATPRACTLKTLQIRNIRKMDKSYSIVG
jgi:hypothetical protein